MVLFGQDAQHLAAVWEKQCACISVSNIEEALQEAFGVSQADDCILLSPACASYDQFRNYIERGKVFSEYVMANSIKQQMHESSARYDFFLLAPFLALISIGLLMVASASLAVSSKILVAHSTFFIS